MSKAPSTLNDGKDRSAPDAPTPSAPENYEKKNAAPTISDEAFKYKPKFNEAERQADPWKGRGGAFTIDEQTGQRIPLEVPYDPNIPLPPDAPPPPAPDTEEAPQDRTPKS